MQNISVTCPVRDLFSSFRVMETRINHSSSDVPASAGPACMPTWLDRVWCCLALISMPCPALTGRLCGLAWGFRPQSTDRPRELQERVRSQPHLHSVLPRFPPEFSCTPGLESEVLQGSVSSHLKFPPLQ